MADDADKASTVALARLNSRYQLLTTVLGTSLVSIIGSWLVFSEQTQENVHNFDSGHREFVAKFVELAIGEDIEKRQRLARYFATVTLDPEQRQLWENYADYVDALITTNTKRIAELEAERNSGSGVDQAAIESELALLRRQLSASRADAQTPESDRCIDQSTNFPARWLCISQNEAALGVAEIAGPESNQRILEYAQFAEAGSFFDNDDIPWSGLFIAWVIAQSGVPRNALPSNPLVNQAWTEFGSPLEEPVPGALGVFLRDASGPGSSVAGFFLREEGGIVELLGGNVMNTIGTIRVKTENLVGYRTYP